MPVTNGILILEKRSLICAYCGYPMTCQVKKQDTRVLFGPFSIETLCLVYCCLHQSCRQFNKKIVQSARAEEEYVHRLLEPKV